MRRGEKRNEIEEAEERWRVEKAGEEGWEERGMYGVRGNKEGGYLGRRRQEEKRKREKRKEKGKGQQEEWKERGRQKNCD